MAIKNSEGALDDQNPWDSETHRAPRKRYLPPPTNLRSPSEELIRQRQRETEANTGPVARTLPGNKEMGPVEQARQSIENAKRKLKELLESGLIKQGDSLTVAKWAESLGLDPGLQTPAFLWKLPGLTRQTDPKSGAITGFTVGNTEALLKFLATGAGPAKKGRPRL